MKEILRKYTDMCCKCGRDVEVADVVDEDEVEITIILENENVWFELCPQCNDMRDGILPGF
jgi:NMD protein affecting ribosome stability and mRNA decay